MKWQLIKNWRNNGKSMYKYSTFPLLSYKRLISILDNEQIYEILHNYTQLSCSEIEEMKDAIKDVLITYFDVIPFQDIKKFYDQLPDEFKLMSIYDEVNMNEEDWR